VAVVLSLIAVVGVLLMTPIVIWLLIVHCRKNNKVVLKYPEDLLDRTPFMEDWEENS